MIPSERMRSQPFLPAVLVLFPDLVRINNVNPAYKGGQSEADVVKYLREYFERHSIETWQQEPFP